MGRTWIVYAMAITTHHPKLSFDLPNLHLLIEFLQRALPALGNGHFCRTGPFEAHHQQVKRVLRDFRAQGVKQFEESTFREIIHQQTLRFVLQGGRWGPNLEHQATADVRSIEDYREPADPHPAMAHFLLPPKPQPRSDAVYPNMWRPANAVGKPDEEADAKKKNYFVPNTSAPSAAEIKQLQLAINKYYPEHKLSVTSNDVAFRWVSGFNKWSGLKTETIRVGDDIGIDSGGGEVRYLRVQKCLMVRRDTVCLLFMFPFWYEANIQRKYDRVPLVSKVASNSPEQLTPFPPHVFKEHVLILHNCKRVCTCDQLECQCDLCCIKQVCAIHQQIDCEQCHSFLPVDYHHAQLNEFMVMDRSLGFELDD